MPATGLPASASVPAMRLSEPGGGMAAAEALVRRCLPRRILDLATGRGSVLQWLREIHPACRCLMGIDVAREAVAAARATLAGQAALLVMDAAKSGFLDSSADMVTIAHSLHHLPDVAGSLREATRVLVPGGWLVVVEMHSDDPSPAQSLHIDMHEWWADVDTAAGVSHRRIYRRDQIVGFMAELGTDLTIVEDPGDESHAHDAEPLSVYGARLDTYADKAKGHEAHEALVARGRELKVRMTQTGCAPPRALAILARKPLDG